jgi:hypothetical protein
VYHDASTIELLRCEGIADRHAKSGPSPDDTNPDMLVELGRGSV